MNNDLQPQKTDVSGTGPAGKPGVKQHCSNYGGEAGRIAAMVAVRVNTASSGLTRGWTSVRLRH